MPAVFGNPALDDAKLQAQWHDQRLVALAKLVRQLRTAQKTGGSGYKTPAAGKTAAGLEKQVDNALTQILGA